MQQEQLSLLQALTQYLASNQSREGTDHQQELMKFVRWSGRDRSVADLTPQQAAEYGEMVVASAAVDDIILRLQPVKDFLTYCYKSKLTETPLAKHVKTRKPGRRTTLQQKARAAMDITPEGYRLLKEELETLQGERVTVAREIHLAAADKDFRENAPLDAARERQGHLEARIRELEDSIQRARLVSADASESASHQAQQVKLGSKVRLKDLSSGDEMAYTLVNASEANPIEYKMSSASPVGKALMGHHEGEEVVVTTPRGSLRYRIQGVES